MGIKSSATGAVALQIVPLIRTIPDPEICRKQTAYPAGNMRGSGCYGERNFRQDSGKSAVSISLAIRPSNSGRNDVLVP
jgi:hypothetical protein